MSMKSELAEHYRVLGTVMGNELDALDRDVSDFDDYIRRNADRISPMLPGGMPRSDPPPAHHADHEA